MNELAEHIKWLRELDAARTAFRDKLDSLYPLAGDMERRGLMANATKLDTLWKSSPNEMFKAINTLVELLAEMRLILSDGLHDADGNELNMSNYNHDDVHGLNNAYVALFQTSEEAITKANALLTELEDK